MEVQIGKVTHNYDHLHVAVLALTDTLKLGDKIHIVGHTTDLIERVASMEVNHHAVEWVSASADVAIKVLEPVHEHDHVYRIIETAIEPYPV